MTANSSSAAPTDAWDDWESEDYGRDSRVLPGNNARQAGDQASNNARLWQVANSSLSFGPSPTQAGSPNNPYAYSSSTSPAPPAAAFAPSLKILKRPSKDANAAALAQSQMSKEQQKKTMKDREKAYLEARIRIFGEDGNAGSGATSPTAGVAASIPSSPNGEANSLASSIENLTLDGRKSPASGSVKHTPKGSPSLGSSGNRNSGRGKSRASAAGISANEDQPAASPRTTRPSTPSTSVPTSTIIREPVNPPSASGKNGNQGKGEDIIAIAQARGFTKTKKKKPLRAAATAFVPTAFGTAAQ